MVVCGLGSVQSLGWNFVFGVPVYGVAGTCFTLGYPLFLFYTAVQQEKCHEKSVFQGLVGSVMDRLFWESGRRGRACIPNPFQSRLHRVFVIHDNI